VPRLAEAAAAARRGARVAADPDRRVGRAAGRGATRICSKRPCLPWTRDLAGPRRTDRRSRLVADLGGAVRVVGAERLELALQVADAHAEIARPCESESSVAMGSYQRSPMNRRWRSEWMAGSETPKCCRTSWASYSGSA
jgi:hypothetical protein